MKNLMKCNMLTPVEVELLKENFSTLEKEYQQTGTISLDSLFPILGRPPIIPQSSDMDARLEAMDARALYGNKAAQIESCFSG